MESCCSQKLNLNSGPSTLQLPKDAMRLSKLSLRVKILECFRLLVEVRKALDLRQDKVLNSLSIKKMQSFRRLSSSKDYSPKCSMKKSKLSHKADREHQPILTGALLKNNTRQKHIDLKFDYLIIDKRSAVVRVVHQYSCLSFSYFSFLWASLNFWSKKSLFSSINVVLASCSVVYFSFFSLR